MDSVALKLLSYQDMTARMRQTGLQIIRSCGSGDRATLRLDP
jgi:hypothetical protein